MEGKYLKGDLTHLEAGLLEKLQLFALSNMIKRPIDFFITNEDKIDKINFGIEFSNDSSIKIGFSDYHYNFKLTFKETEYIKSLSKFLENTTFKTDSTQPSNSLEEEKEPHLSKATIVSYNQEKISNLESSPSSNPSTSVSPNTMKEDLVKVQKDKVMLSLNPITEKIGKRKNRKAKVHPRNVKR